MPAAPDPADTIEAQAKANQITQLTPYGNLIYGNYANGQFSPFTGEDQRQALQIQETPYQNQFRQGGEQLSLGLIEQMLSQGAMLPQVRSASQIEQGLSPISSDFSGDTQRTQNAVFEQTASQLRPEFDRQRRQIEQRLADQGLPVGSEAYNEELSRLEQSQGNQLNQLSLQSVQAGSAEQDRLARLAAALRGQQYNEQAGFTSLENQARAGQFGEIGTLFGLTQPFQQYSTPNIDAAGIINSSYQNNLARSQVQQQGQSGNLGALGALAGAGLSAAGGPASLFGYSLWGSDINLKENIVEKGEENGHKLYEFNYIGNPTRYVGVMAQEIIKVKPEAVVMVDGYMAVNYDLIGVKMRVA